VKKKIIGQIKMKIEKLNLFILKMIVSFMFMIKKKNIFIELIKKI
jgi:hypothetical protein